MLFHDVNTSILDLLIIVVGWPEPFLCHGIWDDVCMLLLMLFVDVVVVVVIIVNYQKCLKGCEKNRMVFHISKLISSSIV